MAAAQRCFVVLFALLSSILCMAQTRQGILPRQASTDYPARAQQGGNAVGAALLTSKEVHNAFASDLIRYLVVEVAVYPQDGKTLKVARDDFALRASDSFLRPLDPVTIADQKQKVSSSDHNIGVYPTAGVGVSTYPTYDPNSGRMRTNTGVYTNVGVGVGVGGGSAASVRNLGVMQQELFDKGFPEGEFSKPVCGYLYFPTPEKKKRGDIQLVRSIGRQQLLIKLPRQH